MSKFSIEFFSEPTNDHLIYYLKEAQKHHVSNAQFERLWFEAYNRLLTRRAEDLLKENYWKLVGMVHDKGNKAQKIQMRKLMNKGLRALEKRFETKIPRLTEEFYK